MPIFLVIWAIVGPIAVFLESRAPKFESGCYYDRYIDRLICIEDQNMYIWQGKNEQATDLLRDIP